LPVSQASKNFAAISVIDAMVRILPIMGWSGCAGRPAEGRR
jgi:hypothetical protein